MVSIGVDGQEMRYILCIRYIQYTVFSTRWESYRRKSNTLYHCLLLYTNTQTHITLLHYIVYIYQYLGYNLLRILFIRSFCSSSLYRSFYSDELTKCVLKKNTTIEYSFELPVIYGVRFHQIDEIRGNDFIFDSNYNIFLTHLLKHFNIISTQIYFKCIVSNVHNFTFLSDCPPVFLHSLFHSFPSHFLKLMRFHFIVALHWLADWQTNRKN